MRGPSQSNTELTPRRRRGASLALLVSFLGAACSLAAEASSALPELTNAAAVRNLTPAEAARQYPVHLKGILTFSDQSQFLRFVQDDTAGIYFFAMDSIYDPNLKAGDRVELLGHSNRGEYAPIVDVTNLIRLGEGVFPPAKPVGLDQLSSGQEDSQFLEIRGQVRAVRYDAWLKYYLIDIARGDQKATAVIKQLPCPAEDLVDAIVLARGVSATRFNLRRQAFNIRILSPRPSDLVVIKPPAGDTFASPAKARMISSLLQFSPRGTYGHRVKVSGTVIYRQIPNLLYIEDETSGLEVQTVSIENLLPGDHVEALGFPSVGAYNPVLQDAMFRKTSVDPIIKPEDVTADEALSGRHDCRLVRLKAVVLDRAHHSQDQFLLLQSGGFIFHAYLQRKGRGTDFAYLQNGCTVRITGVCVIDPGGEWHAGEDWRAKSFRILLRSPNDIELVQPAPRWDLQSVIWAGIALGAATLGAFGWAAMLRRRVRRQTRIIQEKMAVEVALEREILDISNREQRRIGHDLHDGVCQQLAGIALMTSSLADALDEKGLPESKQTERISGLLQSAIGQTRGVARGLFPVKLEENGLVSVLEELAASASELYKVSCVFTADVAPPLISNDVALHLYYIVREAVANAARHGKARNIWIILSDTAEGYTLTVRDNGSGFVMPGETATGMGLRIMQHRARVIEAVLDWQSAPGEGASLTCLFAATPAPYANEHGERIPAHTYH
ncbi:MAG TPA: sensor histidine kinase [Verrucomicrobiae bacterium]|jgi:signal transduction histidine kinase|nr:sensor histidine kinase [Verrucomicrobiae bacterium]